MNKKTVIGSVIALLVLAGSMTWAWWRERESPEMKEARHMHEKLLDETASKSMTDEQQANAWADLKEKAKTLSEEEQTRLWQKHNERAVQEKREYLDRFFSLETKEQRDAFLDAVIDRESNYEKKSTAKQGGKGGEQANKQESFLTAEQQREKLEQLWKSHLNSTTADQRGQAWAYWEAMKERREERGLPAK